MKESNVKVLSQVFSNSFIFKAQIFIKCALFFGPNSSKIVYTVGLSRDSYGSQMIIHTRRSPPQKSLQIGNICIKHWKLFLYKLNSTKNM